MADAAIEPMNEPQDEAPPSLRDTLSAAFEAQNEAPVNDDAPARVRDENGRFAKADTGAPEAAAEAVPADVPEIVADAPSEPENAPEAPVEPIPPAPQSWRAEEKAAWDKAPPEVRAAVERRENEMRQLAGRMDGERQAGRVFTEVITPYLPILRQTNADPARTISDLLQTAYILNTSDPIKKAQTLAQIADQYGIDMDQAYQYRGQHQAVPIPAQQVMQPQPVDVDAMVEAKLAQREAQREIETFFADPKNVHAEVVRDDMSVFLQSGRAATLHEAYDMALWARPDLRSTLLAEQAREREAQQAAERAARVTQAKRAAVSPSNAPGASRTVQAEGTSLRDTLETTLRSISARV